MPLPRTAMLLVACWLAALLPGAAYAEQDPGYDSAVFLLKRAAEPVREGHHNTMLRSLRALRDPDLLPYFEALSASEHPDLRIHGLLGMAELSPAGRIDLALVAEIEDDKEVVNLLSAAIDDGLIDQAGMAAVLKWDGLHLSVRQAIAMRLVGDGGTVDPAPFHVSIQNMINDKIGAAPLMQYAVAALLFAEHGDEAGPRALARLAALEHESAEAVIGQLLDAAMRHEMRSAGALALAIARDTKRSSALRLLGIRAAMRLEVEGASDAWRQMYLAEQAIAQRIRLAMVALDASAHVQPSLFNTIADDEIDLVKRIAEAGRAIAEGQENPLPAFEPLFELGQPLVAQWVVTYCRRAEPAYGPALLEGLIQNHFRGEDHHRDRIIHTSVQAAHAYCEIYPERATERLAAMLNARARPSSIGDDALNLQKRAAMLLGIARVNHTDLAKLAASIEVDPLDNFDTRVLRLLIRARHGATLNAEEWAEVSDVLQGAGRVELSLRAQFAWLYIERMDKADAAIDSVLKQN